jgi:hypothetical protein
MSASGRQNGQGGDQGKQRLRRNVGSGREQVEPEQFEKNARTQGRLKSEGQSCPEQGGEKRTMNEADVNGDPGQGQEGKKKLPPASRMRS